MRALWLEDDRLTLREDVPEPEPVPGEMLIRVCRAGICGTDIELLRGYSGLRGVPGHEFMGEVIVGPEPWPGTRVVAGINIPCGECELCLRGLPNHCARRQVLGIRDRNGAFAEVVAVPGANVYRVPDEITDRDAVLVEPLAAALEIVEQVSVDADDRVLVIGSGRLGQLVIQVLSRFSRRVDVLVRDERRKPAIEVLDVQILGEDQLGNGAYDVVVECSGNPSAFGTALEAVRPRGTLVLKSTYAADLTIDASRIVVNEVNLIGSRCGPFAESIEWLREGKLSLSHLRFEEFPMSDFESALECARRPDVYKVLLNPAG
ncbi:MAG: alcohol dehydrogenase catalytic domain-containing protein [Pseudomonadales bacterium]|nr:alcohol dehydrogenase catalytic domain-containing protein [Pseudomonadales bacterium]